MADLTKIRNLRENQLNEIAIGEIVLNVDALTYVTKNSAGKVVPYDIDYKLPDGDATHLYLKWDETTQQYTARTVAEFISDLAISDVPEGSATALYLKWNNSTDPKRWEALTLAQFKTALAYTTIDAGSATLLYPKWNNSLTKYEGQLPSTVATDIGAVSTLNWGNPEGGYKFDGVDDYVTTTCNLNFTNGVVSFEAFFMIKSDNVLGTIFHGNNFTGTNVNIKYSFARYNTNVYRLLLSDGTGSSAYELTYTFALNTLYHVVLTCDATNVKAYINGVLAQTFSQTTTNIGVSGYLGFGQIAATYFFGGNLYIFRLYNRALTASEVTGLYNNGRPDLAVLPYDMIGGNQTSIITGNDSTFAGASNWANVDLNAYDETTDGVLTLTASAIGQYCTLPVANAGTTIGKKYRLGFDVTSITSTWTVKDFGGTATLGTISATGTGKSIEFTATTAGGLRLVAVAVDSAIVMDNVTLTPIGCVAEYLPKHAGWYSWIETQNRLHGAAAGGVIPLSNKIGDTRTAYLLTTSTTPTMTDVIKAGWAVQSITMTTAENLTDIDATQETSSVALLNNKTLNNGTFTWSVTDHNLYPTADKDIVFALTGNGGAGTHIYVNLKKIV